MSGELYNMIMHGDPEFWSGDSGYVDFPKERFLEYTEGHLVEQFQSLDQNAVDELKKLPTLFAVEHENADTRIGRITNIEVQPTNLRIYYKFSEKHYPLTKGVLQKNWQKLNINKSGYEFYRTHWAVKECNISDFYEGYLKTLTGISHQLKGSDKKVQLIYAFNGSGKTRLSREFKKLISPKFDEIESIDEVEDFGAIGQTRSKILYYNAFTEDLFYWDNDLLGDSATKLMIQPNTFTDWILGEQGKNNEIIANFQHYTNRNLTPIFQEEDKVADGKKTGEKTYPFVSFSIATGDNQAVTGVKISKGEESNFIWSIFFTLIEEMAAVLSVPEVENRSTNQFDKLEYVFIDDPVSSLDDNHLIELAQNLATLIKSSPADGPRFIITTHNPLFYNVLFNALKSSAKYRLTHNEDGSFSLERQKTDSPFSYHLHLIEKLKSALEQDGFEKYHYNLLRNVLEKTSTFLGYDDWSDLLPRTADGSNDAYLKRIVDISSHSRHSGYELSDLSQDDKRVLGFLLGATANRKYEFPERYRVNLEEEVADD